ncbi:GxxExxY protein [candidate division LCP-89 bacterium B3_LCP]|uniref:GxxExxY protein n=1 Tax=candidate division LCP-89 bacterium B3_LCP TaxID=2012998 RepID=A0A532V5F7_UNCL8|nr:MAG: GxxExxY protein [candidate division LCP-89 bacterium B3_LCP]
MVDDTYKYSDITEKIIGCALKVHNALGNGFQEVIYQRSLAIALNKAGLKYHRELEIPVFFEDCNVGVRRADFLVEDKVLVELKAISELGKIHESQIINYLKAYKIEVGLLINFGEKSLKFRRFIKTL